MYKKLTLIFGIILLCISTASAATVEPLSNFKVIEPIDDSMVAGEEGCALFGFTAKYDTTIVINFTIEHPEICSSEWCTVILINNLLFSDEISPGVFSTGEIEISKGYHTLRICYQSNSAIVPDNYNFSLEILSEDVVIASSNKRSGGGSSYTFPTSTPTPTPTPVINETVVAGGEGMNLTPTPTPVKIVAKQVQEPPKSYWGTIIGIILAILILMLIFFDRKRKKPNVLP